MVEFTYPMLLDTVRTAGIIMGIIYYLSILRNQQKTRMLEMVSRRAHQAHSYEQQKYAREIVPMYSSGWSTPEEYYEKYGYQKTPELEIARVIMQNSLNHWGFLFREGVIDVNFIDRLYNPWHIITFWEKFKPLFEDARRRLHPSHANQVEALYNAVVDLKQKKYPTVNV